jgi:spoIIIJ-associated protein
VSKVERTAKTVEDAINDALNYLGCGLESVDIEVVDEGSKGFLGFGGKPAKILAKKKFDPVSAARDFLREVFAAMNIAVDIEIQQNESRALYIDLKGENMGMLIGKRGQTLDSLQYLVSLVVNKGESQFMSITLDAENYRQRRKETLETLASNLAKKVKDTRKSVILEPMNPYERRTIHSFLQGDKSISTHSEGDEPYRYVVIALRKHYDKKKTY